MKPTRPINATGNPDWRYTPSNKTNLKATYARVRREQADAEKAKQAAELERIRRTVTPFKGRG